MKDSDKKKEYTCSDCKDTGEIKYQDITPMTNYRWVPWKKKPCSKCKPVQYERYLHS